MRVLILISIWIFAAACNADCTEWFKKSKLKVGKGCVESCVALPTGMDTSFCPSLCQDLCTDRSYFDKLLGNYAYYPGLTPKEKELIKLYPNQAITVFQLAQKADKRTGQLFGRDTQDDESDAFRHFYWAGLLDKDLGPELAKNFLDAHEFRAEIDANGAMDLANNRAGLLAAEQLRKSDTLTADQIEKMGLKALKDKTLVILKPFGEKK